MTIESSSGWFRNHCCRWAAATQDRVSRGTLKGIVFLWMITATGSLISQTNSASLSGTVLDPSGAVVVGAEVVVLRVDTNVSFTTQTNAAGAYSFPGLAPGNYDVTVRSSGFKQVVQKGLVLHVQDAASQDFRMELGATTDTVTVSGTAATVNTEDAAVGTVVERQMIDNMPLNGRSFQSLITLSPGVNTITPSGNSSGQFVVNGQRSDTSYFTVDGVSANVAAPTLGSLSSNGTGSAPTNSSTGGFNNMVSVDALQEFRITTSSFAPEFGRSPGGQISLVSRGGTNEFHGDVFDYFRNTVLNANDWFLNAAGKARGVVQQNDFGGVVGGPIVKNKLFFFVSYEGLRLSAPTPSVKRVPTQAARTLAAAANGGVAGFMAQFANAYPLPDGNPSIACTTFANCAANYTASFPGKSDVDSTSARVDYSLGRNMSIFGRYAHSPSTLVSENSVTRTGLNNGNNVYTGGWTWTLKTSMSNDVRFNYTETTFVRAVNPLNFTGSLAWLCRRKIDAPWSPRN